MKASVYIPKVLAILLAQPCDPYAPVRIVARMILGQSQRRAHVHQVLNVKITQMIPIVRGPIDYAACEALHIVLDVAHDAQLDGRVELLVEARIDAEVTRATGLDQCGIVA